MTSMYIRKHLEIRNSLMTNLGKDIESQICTLSKVVQGTIDSNSKIIFFGNGGSSSIADHLATELICRFKQNRPPISSLSLTSNVANLTFISNDFGFEYVFSRQIEALATNGDLIIGLTTSGKSPNVIRGLKEAQDRGCYTSVICGNQIELVGQYSDLTIVIPSNDTAIIQECQLVLGHILCELIENMG